MKRDSIQARDITPGMTIVPPIRTMRHALVERVRRDGDGLVIDTQGTPFDKNDIPRNMRNHNTSYIVLVTDIGLKSYDANQVVDVLVYEPHG